MRDAKNKNIKMYNGQEMSASEYYYDCAFDTWDKMLYPEAIIDRKNRAWELFRKLYKESMSIPMNQEIPLDLSRRMKKAKKAFDDNSKLAEEKFLIL
jgi:hypothetical protein